MMKHTLLTFWIAWACVSACAKEATLADVGVGAAQVEVYMPLLQGKRVALLGNHSSIVYRPGTQEVVHVLNYLLENGAQVTAVFAPEHGFRGIAREGELVSSTVDEETGIPILSLYDGLDGLPSAESMGKFDVLIADLQDVGLRFSTYHITMVKMMEACARYGKQFMVFDRPNPNGHYVDGPILDMQYKSGVGWLPIPVVYGMTLGELALMVNGEGWLPDGLKVDLKVISCQNYTHDTSYQIPVRTSPNLRCTKAIYLYPSLCLFEATPISIGRGTDIPFMCYGHPLYEEKNGNLGKENYRGKKIRFTPNQSTQEGRECVGRDLSPISEADARSMGINLNYLIDAYHALKMDNYFFRPFFEKLIGVGYVRKMIIAGKSNEEIRAMWANDVERFIEQRKPYLLYE